MTARARVVAALFLACLLAGMVSGRGLLFNLAYLWGGLFAVAFLWSRTALAGISLERRPRLLRAQVGQAFEESLLLRNASRLPKLWLEFQDASELPDHQASSVVVGLGARAERALLVRTLCTRRGRFRVGPATLVSGDPFGLFPVARPVPQVVQVVVLPMTVPLPSFPLPSGRLPGGEALMERTHQVTPNAAGVRDYQPGDGFNRIHWRSTARRGRLIAKEFELDPLADVWIVLDAAAQVQAALPEAGAGARSPGGLLPARRGLPPSTLEYMIAAAASLAVHLLERDRSVGLIAYGKARHVVQPDRGGSQLYRLLETLAVLDGWGGTSIGDVLRFEAARLPRSATLVILTPTPEDDVVNAALQLRRRALPSVLVLLDAATFGSRFDNRALAAAAQRSGVPMRLVRCGEPLAASLAVPASLALPSAA